MCDEIKCEVFNCNNFCLNDRVCDEHYEIFNKESHIRGMCFQTWLDNVNSYKCVVQGCNNLQNNDINMCDQHKCIGANIYNRELKEQIEDIKINLEKKCPACRVNYITDGIELCNQCIEGINNYDIKVNAADNGKINLELNEQSNKLYSGDLNELMAIGDLVNDVKTYLKETNLKKYNVSQVLRIAFDCWVYENYRNQEMLEGKNG